MGMREQVLAAAEQYTKQTNPKLRWDEWNYFYSQITTQPGPSPEPFGFKRRTDNPQFLEGVDPMTVDFWWDRVKTLIAGASAGGGPSTADTGGSTGGGSTGGGSTGGGMAAGGNVFIDTLLMLLSVIFSGRTI